MPYIFQPTACFLIFINLEIKLHNVLFPPPEGPTTAVVVPCGILKLTSLITFLLSYEKLIFFVGEHSNSIVAISNGYISGRTVGAPMTNLGLDIITSKIYKNSDYKLNYQGVSSDQRLLRVSTFFIKDSKEELVGMLCINFDDKRYAELSDKVLQLCHQNAITVDNSEYDAIEPIEEKDTENFSNSIAEVN